jgi:hypothetical protein
LNGKSVRRSKSIAIAKIVDAPCRESFTLFALSTAVKVSIYPSGSNRGVMTPRDKRAF